MTARCSTSLFSSERIGCRPKRPVTTLWAVENVSRFDSASMKYPRLKKGGGVEGRRALDRPAVVPDHHLDHRVALLGAAKEDAAVHLRDADLETRLAGMP